MNKDYYKYSEILFGLRNEYIANQKLLSELERCVNVDVKNVLSYEFRALPEFHRIGINQATLQVIILKRQKKILNYFLGNRHIYDVVNNGSEYEISNTTMRYFTQASCFDPKIEVLNQDRLNELADQVYHSKLMTMPALYVEISQFQTLWIERAIQLTNWSDPINTYCVPSIYYVPKRDTIGLDLGRHGNGYLADSMLDSKIPRYKIPEEYQAIIDSNPSSEKQVRFFPGDFINGKKTEFRIEESEKEFVLTKTKGNNYPSIFK